jgi:hypothetical protein
MNGHPGGKAAFVLIGAEVGDDIGFPVTILVAKPYGSALPVKSFIISEFNIDIPIAADRKMAGPADAVGDGHGFEAAGKEETGVILVTRRKRRLEMIGLFLWGIALNKKEYQNDGINGTFQAELVWCCEIFAIER